MPGRPLLTSSARPRSRSGSIRTRMRNISLSRSSLVSTVFGVNCAWLARNTTLAGIHGRQIDVHIDVRSVEHRKDLAASREDFTHIGNPVLDAPLARRDEGIVEDVD